MNEYKRELNKVLILLGVGVALVISFMIYGKLSITDFFFDFESMLAGIAILFYPIGIAYGWRQIAGFYHGMRKGDRIGHIRGGYNMVMISAIWIGFAVALTFMFGWIFGTINAIKKLRSLKKTVNAQPIQPIRPLNTVQDTESEEQEDEEQAE